MDVEEEEYNLPENIHCEVCGENRFERRAGFFFCKECGTKNEDLREVEVENEFQQDGVRVKTHKVVKKEEVKPELTSWECYNYILRGLVEELINLGAKDDLKLVTLQLWSAYLRRMEVAFFNKKRCDLPRLNVRYHSRDARAIYNHAKVKRKRRRKSQDSSNRSVLTEGSSRALNKSKRKLDESLYASVTSAESQSRTSANSSSSATTSRAIRINFNRSARKLLKKRMPKKHLAKHEEDTDGELTCHSTRVKAREVKFKEKRLISLNMKHLYAILAIALNLIGDDIQLVDLVRFISEGHIGKKRVALYFPENVVPHSKHILKEIEFYTYREPNTYEGLKSFVKSISECIHVKEFRRPDIISLCKRYVAELNLPNDIALYTERLINLLPPCMKSKNNDLPAYEARAMAYIIFVLKLFFGLDGHKEQVISESAIRVNAEIEKYSVRGSSHPKLFVWSEWVEYIEMRKVIISQYNSVFSVQYKMKQTLAQQLEILKEQREQEVEEQTEKEAARSTKPKVSNLQRILEMFLVNGDNKNLSKFDSAFTVPVQPNFTPAHSYFKRILLHTSAFEETPFDIPEYMRIDHTERTAQPYLVAKSLRSFFLKADIRLRTNPVSCSENREYIGTFHPPRQSCIREYQANFNVDEEEWRQSFEIKQPTEEIEFREKNEKLLFGFLHPKKIILPNQSYLESEALPQWVDLGRSQQETASNLPTTDQATGFPDKSDVLSMHSIDVFNELDMEPIKDITLDEPRRRVDGIDLFADLSEDDENLEFLSDFSDADEAVKAETLNTLKLATPALDYWLVMGLQAPYNQSKLKSLAEKFPRTFLWLLETCAQMLNMNWYTLFKELCVLEITFGMGIENLGDADFRGDIRLKTVKLVTDLDKILKTHCELW